MIVTSTDWLDGEKCYAERFGFKCGSDVANLINHVRESRRAKYEVNYKLEHIGKNKFKVVSGNKSDFGVKIILEEAKSFNVEII